MTNESTHLAPFALRVLRVIFELGSHDRPTHAGALAAELGAARTLSAQALLLLDAAGLVRADQARLTMRGLVLAARLAPVTLREPRKPAQRQHVSGRALRGLNGVRVARACPQVGSAPSTPDSFATVLARL